MKQAKAQHLILDNKAIKNEYKAVLERADDIGKSHLMSSYCMGAYFIALNRKTSLSPEECFNLYKDGLYNNKLFHMVIGNADSYLAEKGRRASGDTDEPVAVSPCRDDHSVKI